MKINTRVKGHSDYCGTIFEYFKSKNLSLSKAVVKGSSKKHYHKKTEEVYYILKGKGIVKIGNKNYKIKKGDIIYIPLNAKHQIIAKTTLHILVINSPPYNTKDHILV